MSLDKPGPKSDEYFDMGLTVPEVASISGHRTVSMLFRYAHADIKTINNKLNL